MNYFEVRERLSVLEKFLALYREYTGFTNRFDNPAAAIIMQKMRPLVPMTIDSLRRVKVGTMITRDAPARGGKTYRINIIKAIFRKSLVKRFHLDDKAPIDAIETAVVKYRIMRSRSLLQLFNPFFWVVYLIGYAADMPFLLLDQCGIDTADFRRTGAGRFLKVLITVVILAAVVELTGLRGWVWMRMGL